MVIVSSDPLKKWFSVLYNIYGILASSPYWTSARYRFKHHAL